MFSLGKCHSCCRVGAGCPGVCADRADPPRERQFTRSPFQVLYRPVFIDSMDILKKPSTGGVVLDLNIGREIQRGKIEQNLFLIFCTWLLSSSFPVCLAYLSLAFSFKGEGKKKKGKGKEREEREPPKMWTRKLISILI